MNILQKLFGNPEARRKQQIELISMLNRWYQVKEDLFFAFEKIAESQIGEPSKTMVNDFVVRVKGGLDIQLALQMMSKSFDDESFEYFIKQISFNLKYKGNIGDLLDTMETQLIQLDEEYTRRRIGTSREKRIINILFAVSPCVALISLTGNKLSRDFFVKTGPGLFCLLLSFFIYIFALLTFIYIGRKSNG